MTRITASKDDRWTHFEDVTRPALDAAPRNYLADIRANLVRDQIPLAVAYRDTPWLFDCLIGVSQFQGISDRNAAAFTAKNGMVGWDDITISMLDNPACPRLANYWLFDGCGYRKGTGTCAEPHQITACSLPTHPARKGTLIIAAHALWLFIRDVCGGDLVGWIDHRLEGADPGFQHPDRAVLMGDALLQSLRNVHGIGDKVWSLALADILLAADPNRERWVTTGAALIVVDSLLHNYLHRTGILRRFESGHAYGPQCYGPNGCCSLLRRFAQRIDARAFNPSFPACFPRFVQFAIWRLSSSSEMNVCNGNRIDDRYRCVNSDCPAFAHCDRLALHPLTDTVRIGPSRRTKPH